MRTDERRIADILEAIEKIQSRMAHSAAELSRDEMMQVWVVYHLQVIGEAARAVSESVKIRYPEVPWAQIIALRNILWLKDGGNGPGLRTLGRC